MGELPFCLEAKHCSGGKVSLYFYLEMDTEGRVGSAAPSLWPWCGSGTQRGASLPLPQFHAPLAATLGICRV